MATVRRAIARVLEEPSSSDSGHRPSTWESLLARAELSSPVRALSLPPSAAVIGVGGATLGGSGRTPVAIAVAAALAARGHRVTLIAHGYGARLQRLRVVRPDSRVEEVGDEAIVAAIALEGRARVVVAPTRDEALAYSARTHDVMVVDRVLQTSPVRLTRSLLVVDDRAPWGSGRMLPFGDLAAPRAALLEAADEVVRVGSDEATSLLVGITRDGRARPLASIAGARVGLVTSVARPGRVVASLAAAGIHPIVHVERDDHARATPHELRALAARAQVSHIDLWLLDAKSSVHLALGSSAATLDHRVVLSRQIVDRIASCVAASRSPS